MATAPTSRAPLEEDRREAYSQACQELRHYSNLRFAILTVFLAINGGLLALLTNEKASPSPSMVEWLRIFGCGLTILFFAAECIVHRSNVFFRRLVVKYGRPMGFPEIGSMSDLDQDSPVWGIGILEPPQGNVTLGSPRYRGSRCIPEWLDNILFHSLVAFLLMSVLYGGVVYFWYSVAKEWNRVEIRDVVHNLTKVLATGSTETQAKAAISLEMLGAEAKEATPVLAKALHDKEARVRAAAAGALGEIDADSTVAVPALQAVLQDPDEGVRLAAVVALGRFGPSARGAAEAIGTVAKNDKSENVRKGAEWSLTKIKGGP